MSCISLYIPPFAQNMTMMQMMELLLPGCRTTLNSFSYTLVHVQKGKHTSCHLLSVYGLQYFINITLN